MSGYSEDNILEIIDTLFKKQHSGLLLGRGDDCCIFKASQQYCVSTDMFLEDVHFKHSYFSASDIGYKSLAVNISDIAACGATPTAFTLNLALAQGINMPWIQEFFQGMSELANKYEMVLAGGDLSFAHKLYISITIWGQSEKDKKFLTRGHCKPDDIIFIVGDLGMARAGLDLLSNNSELIQKKWPKICAAHLHPIPQVEAALTISKLAQEANYPLPALMDISDGLARDLPRLLAKSGQLNCYGAEVNINEHILDQEFINFCMKYRLNPIEEALLGGEDYALLGACTPALIPALQNSLPLFKALGKVTDTGHFMCNDKLVPANLGFDHFSQ